MKTRIFLKTIGDFVCGIAWVLSAFFFSALLLNFVNRVLIEQRINMTLLVEVMQTTYLILYYYGLIWVPLTFVGGFIYAMKGKKELMIYILISMISFAVIYVMRIYLLI